MLPALVLLGLAALAAAVFHWSGVTLTGDPAALARVDVQRFGGTLTSVRAYGPDGRRIPLAVREGRLFPRTRLPQGERVTVDAVVRRSHWLGWAIGRERDERLTVRVPSVAVADRWLTVRPGSSVRVTFDHPVSEVAYGGRGRLTHRTLGKPSRRVAIPSSGAAGTVLVAAAARSWERLGTPAAVSWFPPAKEPVALVAPAPGKQILPTTPIRLTFSTPVGASLPTLEPKVPGRWTRPDSHTLVFTPTGFGAPFGSTVHVRFPSPVAVSASSLRTTRDVSWTVPAGSTLRLHQLLAQAGYLPLEWTPAGGSVAQTPEAEAQAAIDPPKGTFTWRYPNTPPELTRQWNPDGISEITRGAVMMFQDEHGLAVDAIAGPAVWRALLADAIAGKRHDGGYSYVYVHSTVPQSLTLWHNGSTILTSPGNTGVPAAPTQLGTFPVFEHIPVGTMSGTNPDGSHYHDPGIQWISYFNGGDAIHSFNRASFGTPQSLGCVELPLAAAAKVWPYTPIGTLVTVET